IVATATLAALLYGFFFSSRSRHTRSKRDWSSDVCSSDLDQMLMDVGLHRAGVTFTLDRAGLTGDDGPSHNGMWDLAMLRLVPGLRLAAPRDEDTLREALREAVDVDDAPTVLRYPKGALADPVPALSRTDGVDVLGRHSGEGQCRVLVVGIGAFAATAVAVGEALADQGIGSTV